MKITVKQLKRMIVEATGDSGPELVNADNWEHLEVGNVYACKAGQDRFRAEFLGWVDSAGNALSLDVADVEQVQLKFRDVGDDPVEWEAYWHENAFCAGTGADPLYVREE